MRGGSYKRFGLLLAVGLVLAGCQHQAEQQRQAAEALSTGTLAQRQYTTRRFDTRDETAILAASAGVLQDLGFNIDETSRGTGLVIGSKDRDAVQPGQVLFAALLVGMGAKPETTGQVAWASTPRLENSGAALGLPMASSFSFQTHPLKDNKGSETILILPAWALTAFFMFLPAWWMAKKIKPQSKEAKKKAAKA